MAQALHQLVADVTHLEARHYQYVGLAGNGAAGRLRGADRGYERSIGLQFAVDEHRGVHLLGDIEGLHHLVHHFVLRTALGREAQHGNARLDAGHSLGRAGRADGNLSQLVGIGYGGHGHVAHHEHTIVATLGGNGEQKHRATHAGDAGRRLDDLQGGTEHVAGRIARTGQLTVGITVLDNQTAQVEGIFYQLAGLLDGHAFFLAQLEKQLCILFLTRVVVGIDNGGLADVAQAPLHGFLGDFCGVADKNQVSYFVRQYLVGGFQGTFLRALGQHDALPIGLGTGNQLFYEFHRDIILVRFINITRTRGTRKRGRDALRRTFGKFTTSSPIFTLFSAETSIHAQKSGCAADINSGPSPHNRCPTPLPKAAEGRQAEGENGHPHAAGI